MDYDRSPPPPPPPPPNRSLSATTSSTSTSELFFCFTSRLPSSFSMKISSKSIFSPCRAGSRDPPVSLATSLSRRLRTSGSIKGGASPAMFPSTGKKRGAGFENPEPSSPKVTCIGQVRVKSKKKQRKKLRSLSRRHSTGEVSFRKFEHSRDGFGTSHRNKQRWVHLPLTICEALRAFGSEFSCLFPCRSSCFSREKGDTRAAGGGSVEEERNRQDSCGTVCARWLVALHDGDGGGDGGREIELVVGDEEMSIRNSRRHVFEDLEIVNDRIEGAKDEPRASLCIPPKNALLLMRCRSDPIKMQALANRFWEPTMGNYEQEDEEFFDDEIEQNIIDVGHKEDKVIVMDEQHDVALNQESKEIILEMEVKQSNQDEKEEDREHSIDIDEEEGEECTSFLGSLFEENVDQDQEFQENDKTEGARNELFEIQGANTKKVDNVSQESENGVLERETEVKILPECLLLMMCEPKLSMEVSKETWVCSTDFIRRHSGRKKPPPPPPPPPPVKSTEGQTESKVSVLATTTVTSGAIRDYDNRVTVPAPVLHQPARSSCSLPAPPSMAALLEQKLVNAVGYEPFVLTRCKSEPMRTAAAKLVPETCFWKNRKLEPLRRAAFGVGAAGLGF